MYVLRRFVVTFIDARRFYIVRKLFLLNAPEFSMIFRQRIQSNFLIVEICITNWSAWNDVWINWSTR